MAEYQVSTSKDLPLLKTSRARSWLDTSWERKSGSETHFYDILEGRPAVATLRNIGGKSLFPLVILNC